MGSPEEIKHGIPVDCPAVSQWNKLLIKRSPRQGSGSGAVSVWVCGTNFCPLPCHMVLAPSVECRAEIRGL